MHRREPLYDAMVLLGRALFRLLRLRREVRGAEHLDVDGAAVLAVTHFGYLDFALTEWALHRRTGRHARFLVTAAAFDHPVSGPLLRGMGHLPVRRREGIHAYRAATAALARGELVGVFPEGRVHRDDVGPLKTGAIRMAAEAGVPLIPVVVAGGDAILTRGRPFDRRRAFGARVVIAVGEPLHPAPGHDPDALTRELRGTLRALLLQARLASGAAGDHAGTPTPPQEAHPHAQDR